MVKTRIAPSPTGILHFGTARVALYNWLFARQNNGKFLLRVEDTDKERSLKEYEDDIINGLSWLGLDYDIGPYNEDKNGPYNQSERRNIYNYYISKLLDSGYAYYAWETTEELEDMKKQKNFVYRKINYTDEQLERFKSEGRKPVIRFKITENNYNFHDLIKKDISFDLFEFQDFVIVKSDGTPTFFLANVIDDYLMGITHVLRGEDHLSNTPKQLLIYEALGFEKPYFGHLPMLLDKGKKKMSKRDTEEQFVTISKFKERGFLPEALVNFIALLGWHPSYDKDFFSIDELLKEFSLDRVTNSNAVYDFDRLLWFNSEYTKNLSNEDFVRRLKDYLKEYGNDEWIDIINNTRNDYWFKIASYIKIRIQNFGQFKDNCIYFFTANMPSDDIILNNKMNVTKDFLQENLQSIISFIENIDDNNWNEEYLKDTLMNFIKENGWKNGQVLWPIRSILTGVNASPGAFEMMNILGKEETIKRMKQYFYTIS